MPEYPQRPNPESPALQAALHALGGPEPWVRVTRDRYPSLIGLIVLMRHEGGDLDASCDCATSTYQVPRRIAEDLDEMEAAVSGLATADRHALAYGESVDQGRVAGQSDALRRVSMMLDHLFYVDGH